MDSHHETYEEKIGYARGSLWAPFHAVGMVARVKGLVPTEQLEAALRKLQILYPPLASRVRVEKDGAAWLTTEGVEACPLEVRTNAAGDDWKEIFLEQERIPFAFERGPIARFFLLRGHLCSDLIAIAPHVVCDGYAMTQLMSDAVALLNDPNRVVNRPAPTPFTTATGTVKTMHSNSIPAPGRIICTAVITNAGPLAEEALAKSPPPLLSYGIVRIVALTQ